MTPAEIAAKLTQAQVRALRDPDGTLYENGVADIYHDFALIKSKWRGERVLTPLGLAVLAELDKGAKP
jgi:hypothetical protein